MIDGTAPMSAAVAASTQMSVTPDTKVGQSKSYNKSEQLVFPELTSAVKGLITNKLAKLVQG